MVILKRKWHLEHRNKQKDRYMNNHTSDWGEASRQRAPEFTPDHSISTDKAQIAIFRKNRYVWKWHLEHRIFYFKT